MNGTKNEGAAAYHYCTVHTCFPSPTKAEAGGQVQSLHMLKPPWSWEEVGRDPLQVPAQRGRILVLSCLQCSLSLSCPFQMGIRHGELPLRS